MDITLKYAMGEWLRRERRSRRMSAEELGRRLGYCKPSVYQWESGQVYLPLDNFIKICVVLRLDPLREIAMVFREVGLG